MTQDDTRVSSLGEWVIAQLHRGDSHGAVLNRRGHPKIFVESFHTAYMLPDGQSHRLLNATSTYHVVLKSHHGITCKKRKFILFDAINQ